MTTLITFVALTHRSPSAPALQVSFRHVVFSERIRVALGEAWRAFVG